MAKDAVVEIERLSKTYVLGFFRKKVKAVSDVSFTVERGEIFGLLGPNGAGKTTTIKVMLGLVRRSSGSVRLLGRPVGDVVAKRQLGYLPESPYFYDYLSGREFLVFVGQLFGLSPRESRRRADRLLDRVQLGHAATRALRRYSKGMLQRIGIAQALINDPQLVVLDEPLTGLDPLGRKQLRELIASLREEGKTILLCSHVLSDVELLADRVAILVGGRSVDVGPLHQLLDARVVSTEVHFSAEPALMQSLAEQGYRLTEREEAVQILLDGQQTVDPLIDQIRAGGGQLLAVLPRKESLEDVVVRRASDGAADAADDAVRANQSGAAR